MACTHIKQTLRLKCAPVAMVLVRETVSPKNNLGTYSCQTATNLCDGLEVARVRIRDLNDGRYSVQIYDLSDYTCLKNTIKELVTTCDVCDYSLSAKIRCKGHDGGDGDDIIISKHSEFMPAILYIVVTAVATLTTTAVVGAIIYMIVDVRRQKQAARYKQLEQTI